ncbi:MAG: hypothetical protein ACEQSC_01420 [Candidatus Nanopelagicaceae bacterium]
MRGSMAAGFGLSVGATAFAFFHLTGLACPPTVIVCLGLFWLVATKAQSELDKLEEPDPEVTEKLKKLIELRTAQKLSDRY